MWVNRISLDAVEVENWTSLNLLHSKKKDYTLQQDKGSQSMVHWLIWTEPIKAVGYH